MRAVSLWPLTFPTSGEVFVPIVMEIAGSSTWIAGSGRMSSGSAIVSPIVMSSMPAIATMSPAWASSAGVALERPRLEELADADVRARSVVPHPGDGLALLSVPGEHPQQGDAPEERRGVEVRHPGLEGVRCRRMPAPECA